MDVRTVFLSHTSDIRNYPEGRSYLKAAIDAVLRCGDAPSDMDYFAAREGWPAEDCARRVREADVYVGIIGFRLGSIVDELAAPMSFVEFEFTEATAARLPRLLFLLSDRTPLPPSLVDVNRDRIEEFRARLMASSITVRSFTSPDNLETELLHSLHDLRSGAALSTGSARSREGRTMVPGEFSPTTKRPELMDVLLSDVCATDGDESDHITSVEGGGGFGKTTLVADLCRHPRVQERFPGGVLWATVGVGSGAPELSGAIMGLCEVLSPQQLQTTDPLVAGARLGELLDSRPPSLLVIDDVWQANQLAPFLIGGRHCRRVVTTRNRGVAPRGSARVVVDEMTQDQASTTLQAGSVGSLLDGTLDLLLALTGRWPVLLGLVNAAVSERVHDGVEAEEAAVWVTHRLSEVGPTALDIEDLHSRHSAVSATISASLRLLPADERRRYLELAAFPEDVTIPTDALMLLWGVTAGLDEHAVTALRDKLVRLRLVQARWQGGELQMGLHSVIRSYLTHRISPQQLLALHESVVDAARNRLPAGPEDDWWNLPPGAAYLWRYLVYHLLESNRSEQAASLASDLRWMCVKMDVLGSIAEVDRDLASVERDSPKAALLRRSVDRFAHLLGPMTPARALGQTLAAHLDGIDALEDDVLSLRRWTSYPTVRPRWRLPDQPDRALVRTIQAHATPVRSCSFSSDGRMLASAGRDGTIRIWDLDERTTGFVLTLDSGAVGRCVFSPTAPIVAVASSEGSVQLYDVDMEDARSTALGQQLVAVQDCAFSSDGNRIGAVSTDGSWRVWNVRDGLEIARGEPGDAAGNGCALSPDGKLLAIARGDGSALLFLVDAQSSVQMLVGHDGPVRRCVFSPDGRLLATASTDRTVAVWDVSSGDLLTRLVGHTSWVYDCAFSPDGSQIATASTDRSVRLWDVVSGGELRVLTGHTDWVYGCAFAPSGTMLASAGADGTVRLWELGTDDEQHAGDVASTVSDPPGHDDWVYSCAFSPSGEVIATGGDDRQIYIWDIDQPRPRPAWADHGGWVRGCRFSADGDLLVSGCSDGVIRIWAWETGQLRRTLLGHAGAVLAVSFSHDGQSVLSASGDCTLRVWDMSPAQRETVLAGHSGPVYDCSFNRDSSLVVSASDDHTARIWDPTSGDVRHVLAHPSSVYSCVFSPDGETVVTGAHDGGVRVWDAARGSSLGALMGHESTVYGCAFRPDGQHLVSVSTDRTLRIWNVAEEKCVAAMRVGQPLLGCAWSPLGDLICAVGEAGVYVFDTCMNPTTWDDGAWLAS